ncbi:MAG: hypothetical protein QOE33_2191, partial [Acidobacteriota bacterium]|nr:hypothetical protein [Acidobacteriota bacterium]
TTGHGNNKSAVLAAFVSPDESDWRFSFVKLEYALEQTDEGRVRERKEMTPARRYSFIVGSNEHSHTAQRQFLELLENDANDPTLAEIEKAFDIEKVTKEFFAQYKELFESVRDALDAVVKRSKPMREEFERKGIETDDFAKKLLGQLVFLYFLQRKGWFGVRRDAAWGTGDKQYLRHLFDERARYYERGEQGAKHNFFNDILEPLFYNTLATPRRADYSDRFFCKIPFLNGGLFEPLFDYDWVHTDILLPDTLFSNSTVTKDGDRGTGILDVFDRYNFTVNEAEPLERDVAVDPEMLGKVFENLLPENLRHKGGTYYTPRVIVNYMCQQSLINYLSTHLAEVPREDLDTFIRIGYAQADFEAAGTQSHKDKFLPEAIRRHAPQIDRLLEEITVCDPAIGSGAFPVGMMQEIVRARLALCSVEGVAERTTYELKRHAIQNSLYGVDIDPGAVEIAKLRLWLSLVVDEESRERIQALPNLDYKIMQGNSLLEEFRGVKLLDDDFIERNSAGDDGTLDSLKGRIQQMQGEAIAIRQKHGKTSPYAIKHEREIDALLKQVGLLVAQPARRSEDLFASESKQKLASLKESIEQYTNETSPDEKGRLRAQIEQLEWEFMAATLEEHGETEALAELARHRRDNRKNYFLWKLHFAGVFQAKGGFDVIIANPPYLKERDNKSVFELVNNSLFGQQYHQGKMDYWYYFLHKAINIVNFGGSIAFITSRYWIASSGSKKLIRRIKEHLSFTNIVDIGSLKVFENVAGHHMIHIYKKGKEDASINFRVIANSVEDISSLAETANIKFGTLNNSTIFSDSDEIVLNARRLALSQTVELGSVYFVTQGVVQNPDRVSAVAAKKYGLQQRHGVFVLTRAELEKLKLTSQERQFIKEFYDEKHINRFYLDRSNPEFLLYLTKENCTSISQYPNIRRHLIQFRSIMDARRETINGNIQWFQLHWPRKQAYFENEKIVIPSMFKHPTAAFCGDNSYFGMSSNLILRSNTTYSLKYLIAIINSRLGDWWFGTHGKQRGVGLDIGVEKLRAFPIKELPQEEEPLIIKLVDRILAAKRDDPQADTSKLEREIDHLVYQLYELTADEIAIVEGREGEL